MKNEVLKNYLTPKRYAKIMKLFIHKLNVPSHQCCQEHGDKNITAYRLDKLMYHFIYCLSINIFNQVLLCLGKTVN